MNSQMILFTENATHESKNIDVKDISQQSNNDSLICNNFPQDPDFLFDQHACLWSKLYVFNHNSPTYSPLNVL